MTAVKKAIRDVYGDTLAVTNDNICFVWRIEALADRDLKLKPVSAARLPAGR